MPNWCVGTLKVHGKIEDIKNWIENGVGNTKEQPKSYYNFGDFVVNVPNDSYVKGANRNFINGEYYVYEGEDRVYGTLCFDIMAAWGFVPNVYKNLSEKYNLDFRLHGFEKGMGFEQILEVMNGQITIDKEIKYNDYEWESYDPRLGG